MKKIQLINENFSKYKEKLENIFNDLKKICTKLDIKKYNETLDSLIDNLEKPFMFVIIGEVKAGKSSFINALLGEKDICRVDADICTDKVQQIIYSEEEYENKIKENLIEKGVKSAILEDISIVDTPGTDSIIKEHEIITKEFAPNSDLVIFVFPVLNPHHGSAWKMLEFMKKEWNKNIIFIGQQADRCTEKEIEINVEKIKQYAIERGISDPLVFTTSAKEELEGKENEGIENVRAYIKDSITGGKHLKLKIEDRIKLSEKLIEEIEKTSLNHFEQLKTDKSMKEDINKRFASGEKRAKKEINSILERIMKLYKNKTDFYIKSLEEKLSTSNLLKQLIPLVKKEKINKEMLEGLCEKMKDELEKELSKEASENANHFIDGIKELFTNIMNELDRSILSNEKNYKAYDSFNQRRSEILEEIKEKLVDMSDEEKFMGILEKNTPRMSGIAFGGGTLAVAGALLAVLTQGSVLDATGGILSAIGILGAGSFMLLKKGKVLKEFSKAIKEAGNKFEDDLKFKFNSKLGIIYEEINRLFEKLDSHIEKEEKKVNENNDLIKSVKEKVLKVYNEVK